MMIVLILVVSCLSAFLAAEAPYCLAILTRNRASCLLRLFESTFRSRTHHYMPIYVYVDPLDDGSHCPETLKAVEIMQKRYSDHTGTTNKVTLNKNTEKGGILGQYLRAGTDSRCNTDNIVVLEDDAELGTAYDEYIVNVAIPRSSERIWAMASLASLPPIAIQDELLGTAMVTTNETSPSMTAIYYRQMASAGNVCNRRIMNEWSRFIDKYRSKAATGIHQLWGSQADVNYAARLKAQRPNSMWTWWFNYFVQATSRAVLFPNYKTGEQGFLIQHDENGENIRVEKGAPHRIRHSLYPIKADEFIVNPASKALDLYDWDGKLLFKRYKGLQSFLQSAMQLQQTYGHVLFAFVRSDTKSMCRSYICNMKLLKKHQNVLIVTSDSQLAIEMTAWWNSVGDGEGDGSDSHGSGTFVQHVHHVNYETLSAFKHRTEGIDHIDQKVGLGYTQTLITTIRHQFISILLDYGVNVLVQDCDYIWLKDATVYAPYKDVINIDNNNNNNDNVKAHVAFTKEYVEDLDHHHTVYGFPYITASPATAAVYRQLWYYGKYILNDFKERHNHNILTNRIEGKTGHHHHHHSQIHNAPKHVNVYLKLEYTLLIEYLKDYNIPYVLHKQISPSMRLYPCGTYYTNSTYASLYPNPVVIHNTFLRTAVDKILRAKEYQHLFIDQTNEKEQCADGTLPSV